MKLKNNKLIKYGLIVAAVFVGLFIYSAISTKKQVPIEPPAEYTLTKVQSKLEPHFLDQSLGKTITETESTNPQLLEVDRTVNSAGYIDNYYLDANKNPFEIISDGRGKVVALIRTPSSESERDITSLKSQLGLGEPDAKMYPANASLGIIHIYLKEGVAVFFDEEFGRVDYIITFKSMLLDEFKRVFAEKFQTTRNTRAY